MEHLDLVFTRCKINENELVNDDKNEDSSELNRDSQLRENFLGNDPIITSSTN